MRGHTPVLQQGNVLLHPMMARGAAAGPLSGSFLHRTMGQGAAAEVQSGVKAGAGARAVVEAGALILWITEGTLIGMVLPITDSDGVLLCHRYAVLMLVPDLSLL